MQAVSRLSGIAGLLVHRIMPTGSVATFAVPVGGAKPWLVSGAGNGRRRATSLPNGRASNGRFAGAAGKLRP